MLCRKLKQFQQKKLIKLFENNNCNLIDVREINELENSGKVQGANHIPRGMLEVYLDPTACISKWTTRPR